MSPGSRIAAAITDNARLVLVAALVVTVALAAGVPALESDTSMAQFEGDSPEAEARAYAEANFAATATENATTVQVVVRGEDVLAKESLLASLELQRAIREDDRIAPTLTDETPIAGLENVVATTVVREERAAELEERAAELERRGERLNATADGLRTALEEVRDAQRRYERLNESAEADRIEEEAYRNRSRAIEREIDATVAAATADLDADEASQFERSAARVRSIQGELSALDPDEFDSEAAYEYRRDRLEDALDAAYTDGTIGVLGDEYEELRRERERLEADRAALESAGQPPLSEQIAALKSLDESAYRATLKRVLDGESDVSGLALEFLPSSYEPGSTDATARLTVVSQSLPPDAGGGLTSIDDRTAEGQLALRALADEHTRDREETQDRGDAPERNEEYVVVGAGVLADELDRSMTDSLAIVGPIALTLVVLALSITYRDPLDIALGVAGVLTVLVWTAGIMGWAGIAFNQAFVAVPALLAGLSIDYAIHVVMRYRERRAGEANGAATVPAAADRPAGVGTDRPAGVSVDRPAGADAGVRGDNEPADADDDSTGVREAMAVALSSVGVALAWVTATTAIGFLSNLASPIAPIREFGVVSAVGVVAALAIFGAVVPAAKVKLDAAVERRGLDRQPPAFGGDGRVGGALSVGAVTACRAPLAVLLVALLLTAGGLYGATAVDTSFDRDDFLADDPPGWTERFPDRIAPGEYRSKDDLDAVAEHFDRNDARVQVLVRGDVTDGETLQRLAAAREEAAGAETVYVRPDGRPDVDGPLSLMEELAAEDESFNASFRVADRTGDRVPDQNVAGLYDQLFERNPAAAGEVVHRTDGSERSEGARSSADGTSTGGDYEAVRMLITVRGDADGDATLADARAVAAAIERGDSAIDRDGDSATDRDEESRLTAIATGAPVMAVVLERDVTATVLESLVLTLAAIGLVLATAYRLRGVGATFGVVTLLPVVGIVGWIVGTMALLAIPFNVLTATIASLTLGLGIDYSIHVSSRYRLELRQRGDVREALERTIRGTGGALLGSALTTIGGVGTLVLAVVPVLRQFGLVTALMIGYAFLASVFVLPALLVLWTRHVAPDDATSSPEAQIAAGDRGGDPSSDAVIDPTGATTDSTVSEADTADTGSDLTDTGSDLTNSRTDLTDSRTDWTDSEADSTADE